MTTERGHEHGEAFCLMWYQSDDGTERERIWNSRDGVTPFVIGLRSGKAARHVDWHLDEYRPDFQPPAGSRMFVDLTEERALEHALANAHRYFAEKPGAALDPRAQWATPEDMAADLARDHLRQEGAPDLVEVQ